MINLVIKFLKEQLDAHLLAQIPFSETERVVASNVVQQEQGGAGTGVSDLIDNRILLSLIHIEEERVLKDQRRTVVTSGPVAQYREPDIRINLYVLFAAHFQDYLGGLEHLSSVIEYFQAKNVFESAEFPGLDPRIGKIVADLHTFSLDQNFQFWQSLGGKFLPSVMYKIRLLIYQANAVSQFEAPVTEIIPNLHTQS